MFLPLTSIIHLSSRKNAIRGCPVDEEGPCWRCGHVLLQVHQVPLESTGQDKRAEVCSTFGIYDNTMKVSEYGENLAVISEKTFLDVSGKFFDSIAKMLKGAEVELQTTPINDEAQEA